jgi:dTDP-4-dehydrorhamnose reductase
MEKILVFGHGFLGTKLQDYFTDRGQEITCVSTSSSPAVDITNSASVENAISSFNPDTIILVAALSNVRGCEENKEKARSINVTGTQTVVDACRNHGLRLVFFSSDAVFDGKKGQYTEHDTPHPVNYYGQTKWEAEQIVASLEGSLILRTAALYGYNSRVDKKAFFSWVLESLMNGEEIEVLSDQIFSPTLIDDVCVALYTLLEQNETGLFHCTGSESLSRYDFAVTFARVYGLDHTLVKETTAAQLKNHNLIASNFSLSIKKLENKGISMHSCTEGIGIMKRQWDADQKN